MAGIFLFVFGLIVGSFLNVCIYRMPRRESVVSPRSHCTSCGKTIAWYDNIPLLSFILLKGKCRHCGKNISFLYFVVELLTGILFVLMHMRFGLSLEFFVFTALVCGLIIASFIDLKIQEIPDEITMPGLIIGIVLGFLFPRLLSQSAHLKGLFYSFLGALTGGGLVYLMGVFGKAAFKKEAMGGGDVKLMAMLGAFLGWRLIILTFFLAPFFGSAIGIVEKIKNRADVIPYGPHISLAAVISILWGKEILKSLLLL